ncbi:hypothetical protein YC2023_063180 [Brassica napus]
MAEPQDEQSPSLDDCLKLLKVSREFVERVVAMEVRIMMCICGCLLQSLLRCVPEITSSVEMVSQIPLILEIMSKATNILEERYKLLYLVSTACEVGVMALINSGGLRVIAPQIKKFPMGGWLYITGVKESVPCAEARWI